MEAKCCEWFLSIPYLCFLLPGADTLPSASYISNKCSMLINLVTCKTESSEKTVTVWGHFIMESGLRAFNTLFFLHVAGASYLWNCSSQIPVLELFLRGWSHDTLILNLSCLKCFLSWFLFGNGYLNSEDSSWCHWAKGSFWAHRCALVQAGEKKVSVILTVSHRCLNRAWELFMSICLSTSSLMWQCCSKCSIIYILYNSQV